NRPDWCISRQRAWGVPIPAVDCTACGEALLTPELITRAADVFEQHTADAWYERPIEEFLPPGVQCPSCGGTEFERERDILDVWFDSGSSHEAVLPFRTDLTWPADLYLEGSDQHRGWFQSSLLLGLGTRGRRPYHQMLTHGFLIDVDGRKVSMTSLEEMARYGLVRYADAARAVLEAYGAYGFPVIFQRLNSLGSVDLSAFCADVWEDGLYSRKPASPERRSAQTAMYSIAEG